MATDNIYNNHNLCSEIAVSEMIEMEKPQTLTELGFLKSRDLVIRIPKKKI